LLDAVIFNIAIAIGNGDGHARNYSIGLSAGGRLQLAPLYEPMSGRDWRNIAQNPQPAPSVEGAASSGDAAPASPDPDMPATLGPGLPL
jgi:hypothetical protein